MKRMLGAVLLLMLLTGCKVQMDDCYRAIYDYIGPKRAESFTMEVTQKGIIKDVIRDDEQTSAWVMTEPAMWVEVETAPEDGFQEGERVTVFFLVRFQPRGKLDIVEKWLEKR